MLYLEQSLTHDVYFVLKFLATQRQLLSPSYSGGLGRGIASTQELGASLSNIVRRKKS
jgi:hypothetical protein